VLSIQEQADLPGERRRGTGLEGAEQAAGAGVEDLVASEVARIHPVGVVHSRLAAAARAWIVKGAISRLGL
jgi:hypothetical protein